MSLVKFVPLTSNERIWALPLLVTVPKLRVPGLTTMLGPMGADVPVPLTATFWVTLLLPLGVDATMLLLYAWATMGVKRTSTVVLVMLPLVGVSTMALVENMPVPVRMRKPAGGVIVTLPDRFWPSMVKVPVVVLELPTATDPKSASEAGDTFSTGVGAIPMPDTDTLWLAVVLTKYTSLT